METDYQSQTQIGAPIKKRVMWHILVAYCIVAGILSITALLGFRPAPLNIALGLVLIGISLAIIYTANVRHWIVFAILLIILTTNIFWMQFFILTGMPLLFLVNVAIVFGKNLRTKALVVFGGVLTLGLFYIISRFLGRSGFMTSAYCTILVSLIIIIYCIVRTVQRKIILPKVAIFGACYTVVIAIMFTTSATSYASWGGWKFGGRYYGLPSLVFDRENDPLISKAETVPCPGRVQICPDDLENSLPGSSGCIVVDFQSACIDASRGHSFIATMEASNRKAIDNAPIIINPLGSLSSPTWTASYREYAKAESIDFIADPPTFAEGEIAGLPLYIAVGPDGTQVNRWRCTGAGDMNAGPNHQRTFAQFELAHGFDTLRRTFVFMNGELDCQILELQNWLSEQYR